MISTRDRERIDKLDPRFQPIVTEVLTRAWERRGMYPYITQGRRSRELQACIYARSRVPAGSSRVFDGLTVNTTIVKTNVVARCGSESYTAPLKEWGNRVTKVLWSWHIVGFAVDISLRSGSNALDDAIRPLEAARKWAEIEKRFTALDTIWREVAPDTRWGNDWNQNGIPVARDPKESFADMPHWEWHPGKTLDQVRAGSLPPFVAQCDGCKNFRGIMIQRTAARLCPECDAARDSGARCVGLR